MLFIIGAVDSAPARTYTVDMEENVMQVIDSFGGEYSFLSNFHKCKVEFEGMTYPSVEHAFQAAKNPDPERRRRRFARHRQEDGQEDRAPPRPGGSEGGDHV